MHRVGSGPSEPEAPSQPSSGLAGGLATEVRSALPGCMEINNVNVDPGYRGQGLGTALIHAAEIRVRSRGHSRVGLGVDEDNRRAAQLYQRLGYRDRGVRYVSRYAYADDQGTDRDVEANRFLIKELVAPADSAGQA